MTRCLFLLLLVFGITLGLSGQDKDKIAKVERVIKHDRSLHAIKSIFSNKSDRPFTLILRRIDFNHKQLIVQFSQWGDPYDLIIQQDSTGIYFAKIVEVIREQDDRYDFKPIFLWVDSIRLSRFLSNYNTVYNSELDTRKIDSFRIYRYGRACSAGGMPQIRYKEMLDIVDSLDYSSMQKMLRSFDYESKVIAATGFFLLEEKGIKILENELKIISHLKSLNLPINFCYGCTFWDAIPSGDLLGDEFIKEFVKAK